ncbi:MAG TPA: aspartate kinase, partial [Chitinophagaceae bacterium]|nr:aspartate kinase [Chitinophagaceae bacterium]
MNVFKFGGASIESVGRARNMTELIAGYSDEHLLVVISAKGKTTNALEEVVKEYVQEEQEKAMALFETLKQDHREYASELLGGEDIQLWNRMQELCTEVDWLLNEKPVRSHDYYYDQIVCIGELLSTAILQAYMQSQGISSCWIDIRDVMKTDDQYRDATVLWDKTRERTLQVIGEAFVLHRVVVTQGFIGSTDDNASVTLGREGSDYTAAVLANCLDAAGVTIWKDVPSLLNADPKIFPNTVPIREISFREVIEMAYYGAQVIHPKTIKPLQNKHIPLYVKCFLDKKLPGTVIHEL